MLRVPRSVLSRLSDYHAVVTDGANLLKAVLVQENLRDLAGLDLARVHQLGWEGGQSQALYGEACGRLAEWCVEQKRYLNSVGFEQWIGWTAEDRDFLCTPVVPSRQAALRQRKGGDSAGEDGASPGFEQRRRSTYKPRVTDDLLCWTSAEHVFEDGELVLIDAPVCIAERADGPPGAFLCDFPPFLRRRFDPHVPLAMSERAARELAAQAGRLREWHPFCRILGTVQRRASGQSLAVFQIAMRAPLWTSESVMAGSFGDDLMKEADSVRLTELRRLDKLTTAVAGLRAGPQEPLEDAATATPAKLEDLRNIIELHTRHETFWRPERESTPYEGEDAFWCALVVILEAWPDRFGVMNAQRDELLALFDKKYSAEWHAVAAWLARLDLIRYTPSLMAGIRDRVTQLTGPAG